MALAARIDGIPDELLLQVFSHLAAIGPLAGEAEPWYRQMIPFITNDSLAEPHPRLRSYPFLGQVCRKWHKLLQSQNAQAPLWQNLVINFGHEMLTAIHTPLEWSSQRPSDEQFRELFAETRMSAAKIVDFVSKRRGVLRALTLLNSDGYYTEEGNYVSLSSKHDFTMGHLGLMLGVLQDTLQELTLQHCNDLFGTEAGHWSLLGLLPNLRRLTVSDARFKATSGALAQLSCLQKLETLHISAEEHAQNKWAVGIDVVPPEWRTLTCLTSLELRFHSMLDCVPQWLSELPSLHKLDVSFCASIQLSALTQLTGLKVLALQGLELGEAPGGSAPLSSSARRYLPDLAPLVGLTALNLAENAFTRVPQKPLAALTALQVLDLSENADLQVPSPLNLLQRLPALAVVDARGVHQEKGRNMWGKDKGVTMMHLAQLSRVLRRRPYPTKVLITTD